MEKPKCDYCDNDAAIYSSKWAICGECPDTKREDEGENDETDKTDESPTL